MKKMTDTAVIGRYELVGKTAELMWRGLKQGVKMNVIINNRAGGNAPMIAQHAAKRFLSLQSNLD
jgi:hypothetical protein